MALEQLTRIARPLISEPKTLNEFDPVIERIGEASVVLIGEATHGTHEFYDARAALTSRLIVEKGFAAVVAEADWPDAYRVNRFIRGEGADENAADALGDFQRFPTWMWRNTVVERFTGWLRTHNHEFPAAQRVGFYGMDLYSLYRSMEKVLSYLDEVDPDAARRARARYACFSDFGEHAQLYGQATGLGLSPSCEQEAVDQLVDMRLRSAQLLRRDGLSDIDEQFFAERNAVLVRDAERYYRSMFRGRVNTWNLRDQHMVDTCEALRKHLGARGPSAKIVVWAHNSHLGDARATQWAAVEQVNVGQLMRERHGDDCVIVGFTTHEGSVTAASDWDGPAEHKEVQRSLTDSWERTLHDVGLGRFCVITREADGALDPIRLHRAIGVIYRPETERMSHYFESRIGRQYDVILHYDHTQALQPLERWPKQAHPHEPSETYPFGV